MSPMPSRLVILRSRLQRNKNRIGKRKRCRCHDVFCSSRQHLLDQPSAAAAAAAMERCISSTTTSTKQSVPYLQSTCGFLMMVGVIFLIHGASGFSATLHLSFSGKNLQRRRTMELLFHSSLSSVTRSTSRSSGGLTNATNFSYDGGSASAGVMESFQHRQAMYDRMRMKAACSTSSKNITRTLSIWSFEALFPKPVWDEEIIQQDLSHYVDAATLVEKNRALVATKDLKATTLLTDKGHRDNTLKTNSSSIMKNQYSIEKQPCTNTTSGEGSTASINNSTSSSSSNSNNKNNGNVTSIETIKSSTSIVTIDVELTRKVKDRVYGMRTITTTGGLGSSPVYDYDTSLIDASRAVQFTPDGRRIGRALKINIDTLTYTAKSAFRKHNVKLAEQLYSRANNLDPYDGRPYLGLSRCAEKRQDLVAARNYLKMGIRNAIYDNNIIIISNSNNNKRGLTTKNPFLLQALGTLEEKVGHLAEAERLYVAAVNAQPSHAAAWVALAQLRTEKLRQSVDAGRSCYESAKRELALANLPPSSYVYVAWAALEWKRAGNVKLARNLFHQAIAVDPKCSAAYLQLGVMEAEVRNWNRARECFESVLIFDNRNSRALQAFAIMESKRPDGDSRTAIGLFEQALKVNPKDAGVYQAYALYVASLGDIDAARNLLKRGTIANKKHAPVWQAWGVLESRHGAVEIARDLFQQGIWSCAQPSGGQSGGRHCARLWQAWGLLEEGEGDYAAARRCFSRAIDADNRNVAAITAWTLMEERLGNLCDARAIFERALKQFTSPASDDNMSLWRAYELMETRVGNLKGAQAIYQRYTRASFADTVLNYHPIVDQVAYNETGALDNVENKKKRSVKKPSSSVRSEVWLHNGAVEGKIPVAQMRKFTKNKKEILQ